MPWICVPSWCNPCLPFFTRIRLFSSPILTFCRKPFLPSICLSPQFYLFTFSIPLTLGNWHFTLSMSFYVAHSADFHKDPHLFVAYGTPSPGFWVSSQCLAGWIKATIKLAYDLSQQLLPQVIRTHSTRAVAASTAFIPGVSHQDVCAAAIWSMPSMLVSHCACSCSMGSLIWAFGACCCLFLTAPAASESR